MLALSIRQPWAHAILHWGKDLENRSWPTKIRGRVLIHAAARPAGCGLEVLDRLIATDHPAGAGAPRVPADWREQLPDLPMGGIIGSVEIVGCVSRHDARAAASPWFGGPYGFLLASPQPCTFVPMPGRQKFFRLPDRAQPV